MPTPSEMMKTLQQEDSLVAEHRRRVRAIKLRKFWFFLLGWS